MGLSWGWRKEEGEDGERMRRRGKIQKRERKKVKMERGGERGEMGVKDK